MGIKGLGRRVEEGEINAGALARRDFDDAIRLLESEKKLGALELNDLFILTYVYAWLASSKRPKTS